MMVQANVGRRGTARRRGAVVVEFAFVAMFLCMLIIGMWELGRMIIVQQVITNACREAGRQAACGARSNADVVATAKAVLRQNNLPDASATVTLVNLTNAARSDPRNMEQLDRLRVTVSLPFNNVRWVFLNTRVSGINTLTYASEWTSMRDVPVTVTNDLPRNPGE